jgi:PIN domain nuclease of toxin-antitoxin system
MGSLMGDGPVAAVGGSARVARWTRDPFDRLLVAHARIRGWKLATGDAALLDELRPSERVPL